MFYDKFDLTFLRYAQNLLSSTTKHLKDLFKVMGGIVCLKPGLTEMDGCSRFQKRRSHLGLLLGRR